MAELYNKESTDRVIFPIGKQKRFLIQTKNSLGMSWSNIAKLLGLSYRSLSYYRNEKYTLRFDIFIKLINLSGTKIPKGVVVKKQFWSNKDSGILGGKKVYHKYGKIGGNELYRINQWKKWWKRSKKIRNAILMPKKVAYPRFSLPLAEFFGIMIGDGSISKYQTTITLNNETDKKYANFVCKLIYNLFHVYPRLYKVKNSKANNIVVSRINLVNYLVNNGLVLGHKINQKISIPEWIMRKKDYKIFCLRGLIDTDGSIIHEIHKIKNNTYKYPRLNFTSASKNLIEQVFGIFSELKFTPKIRRGGRSVQLENIKEICDYFSVVGTSNPKHKERIRAWYQ